MSNNSSQYRHISCFLTKMFDLIDPILSICFLTGNTWNDSLLHILIKNQQTDENVGQVLTLVNMHLTFGKKTVLDSFIEISK